MPSLTRSLQAFGTPDFEATLKQELAALGPDALGLQQGLMAGSVSLGRDIGIMLLRVREEPGRLAVRAGVFFTSALGGCACADDPTPEETNHEYCELELDMNRSTGEARITIVQ